MKKLEDRMKHALEVADECKIINDERGEAYFIGKSMGFREALYFLKELEKDKILPQDPTPSNLTLVPDEPTIKVHDVCIYKGSTVVITAIKGNLFYFKYDDGARFGDWFAIKEDLTLFKAYKG